jgi:hypothetical protein
VRGRLRRPACPDGDTAVRAYHQLPRVGPADLEDLGDPARLRDQPAPGPAGRPGSRAAAGRTVPCSAPAGTSPPPGRPPGSGRPSGRLAATAARPPARRPRCRWRGRESGRRSGPAAAASRRTRPRRDPARRPRPGRRSWPGLDDLHGDPSLDSVPHRRHRGAGPASVGHPGLIPSRPPATSPGAGCGALRPAALSQSPVPSGQ